MHVIAEEAVKKDININGKLHPGRASTYTNGRKNIPHDECDTDKEYKTRVARAEATCIERCRMLRTAFEKYAGKT